VISKASLQQSYKLNVTTRINLFLILDHVDRQAQRSKIVLNSRGELRNVVKAAVSVTVATSAVDQRLRIEKTGTSRQYCGVRLYRIFIEEIKRRNDEPAPRPEDSTRLSNESDIGTVLEMLERTMQSHLAGKTIWHWHFGSVASDHSIADSLRKTQVLTVRSAAKEFMINFGNWRPGIRYVDVDIILRKI
jgi:hypothetical protein